MRPDNSNGLAGVGIMCLDKGRESERHIDSISTSLEITSSGILHV